MQVRGRYDREGNCSNFHSATRLSFSADKFSSWKKWTIFLTWEDFNFLYTIQVKRKFMECGIVSLHKHTLKVANHLYKTLIYCKPMGKDGI